MHEVGARHSVSPLDLSKMLFNQIGTCSTVLMVPDGPCVVSLLVIMCFLDLLLEPKLFKDLEVDQARTNTLPTASLVVESKERGHNDLLGSKGNIYSKIAGSVLHSTRFAEDRDKLLDTLLVQMTEFLGGIITLLVNNGINILLFKPREMNILATKV